VFCNSRIARRTSQYVAFLACQARTMANSAKTEQLAESLREEFRCSMFRVLCVGRNFYDFSEDPSLAREYSSRATSTSSLAIASTRHHSTYCDWVLKHPILSLSLFPFSRPRTRNDYLNFCLNSFNYHTLSP
jgi:hypothetical protein